MNRCRERLPPSAPDFLFKEASPKPYDYAKFPENSSAARASCAGGVKKALPELYQFLVGMVAPQVGLEPTTLRLTAECSAIELLRLIPDGSSVFHFASIGEIESGDDLISRAVSSQVPSAC